ncbi:MAG: hotdog family protein [Xanthomonadaceae bacterium]|nr:hotdog family protein [Xanthomonadaceae bacterium]
MERRHVLDIETVMPHRGAMRLVDRVLEHDAEAISVEARVRADGPFHVDGGLPAYVGVELMAQAIACWAGVRARAQGLAPPVGFLLGTRRYEAHVQVFGIGEVLRVTAHRELMADSGLAVFSCTISARGVPLASAHVSVFEPPDAGAYLEQGAQGMVTE